MSVEQWDQVGWAMLAAFFAIGLMTQPGFLTWCLIFGFVVWLLRTSFVDPTK